MANKEKNTEKQEKMNLEKIFMITSVVLFVLLVVSIFTEGFEIIGTIVGGDDIKEKITAYTDTVLQGQANAKVKTIEEESGLYKVDLEIDSKDYKIYVSKDGKIMFPVAILLDKVTQPSVQPSQSQEIPKKQKPIIQLFVMSKCPYGIQAENALFPVIKLFKSKVDFKLHFIANEKGTGFDSLHSQPEVNEDLRQVVVMKYYSDTYMDYISCQNSNYLKSADLETTWKACLTSNNMDITKVEAAYKGKEGADLLRANIKAATEKDISSSPTLLINDVNYNGKRISSTFQTAICNAFTTTPSECSQKINDDTTQQDTPAGDCSA